MKVLTLLCAVLLTIINVANAQETTRIGDLILEKPWARASVIMSRPTAAYGVIHNKGTRDDVLVKASSSASGRVEIHKMVMDNGVMRMAPSGPLIIPAGGQLVLKPGGFHIMLMDLKAPLVEGETVDLTLQFERTGTVTVTAPIYKHGMKMESH